MYYFRGNFIPISRSYLVLTETSSQSHFFEYFAEELTSRSHDK